MDGLALLAQNQFKGIDEVVYKNSFELLLVWLDLIPAGEILPCWYYRGENLHIGAEYEDCFHFMGKEGLQLLLGYLLRLDHLCWLQVYIAAATSEYGYEFVEEGDEAFLEGRQ